MRDAVKIVNRLVGLNSGWAKLSEDEWHFVISVQKYFERFGPYAKLPAWKVAKGAAARAAR